MLGHLLFIFFIMATSLLHKTRLSLCCKNMDKI